MDRGRAELVAILEHIDRINSDKYGTEVVRSRIYDDLEKLRKEAEGGEARTTAGCLVDIVVSVFLFLAVRICDRINSIIYSHGNCIFY